MTNIILVAFDVDSLSRDGAHLALQRMLPKPGTDEMVGDERVVLDSWWVAEDDRKDGSDNDSAVFVPPGTQHQVSSHLAAAGLTPEHNVVNRGAW